MIDKKFISFARTQAGHRVPVPTRLAWDPDEPLTVQADFIDPLVAETVTWRFGRDLLTEGCAVQGMGDKPAGDGDARFRRRENGEEIVACLTGAGGHIDMLLPYDHVVEFLEAANEVCEPGSDEEADLLADSLDRLIAEVYEEGDRA